MRIADGWFDSWSPDGRLVAYTDGIDYRLGLLEVDGTFVVSYIGEVWVAEADGSNSVLLTARGEDPRWSPR